MGSIRKNTGGNQPGDKTDPRTADLDGVRKPLHMRGIRTGENGSVLLPFVKRDANASGVAPVSSGSRIVLRVVEALVIVVCSLLADIGYHELVLGGGSFQSAFWAAGLLAALIYVCVMHAWEAAQPLRSMNSFEALRDVTLAWLGSIGAVTFFAFALKSGDIVSRGSIVTLLFLGFGGLAASRFVVPKLLARAKSRRAALHERVIVIGMRSDHSLEVLLSELRHSGIGVSGVFRLRNLNTGMAWKENFEATMPKILDLARTAPDGEICVAAGGFSEHELHDLIVALQVVPRAVRIVPSASIEQYLHFPVRSIGRLLSVEPQKAPLNRLQLSVKRAIDVVAGTVALIALLPVLVLAAIAIKLETRGNILFLQDRLGHRGVPFSIYKFRTMTVSENGAVVVQAHANDKRVTRVGYWLRRLSIDELPQLINIIQGDMSLVGPRPHAIAHDRYYAECIENYEIRQHVKPGLTGWAQVNGLRGETSAPELMRRRVEFDIWYAKNASIMLDIRILLLTAIEVFRQRNAH